METEITENKEKHPTIDEIREMWRTNVINARFPSDKKSRVVDQYGKDEIGNHVMRFAQHCSAKGINPTVAVILDWLYSEKAFDERDDFVTIDKLMEMVGNSQIYPLLIMEVLDYAKKVEKAAISVNEELGHLSEHFSSLGELKKALEIRLNVKDGSALPHPPLTESSEQKVQ